MLVSTAIVKSFLGNLFADQYPTTAHYLTRPVYNPTESFLQWYGTVLSTR
ncbi:putative polyketide synthase [Dirofilaria immitis]